MRVVVLGLRGFPDIQGGVETHCEQLYPRVAAEGHEVIVIGRKPYQPYDIESYQGVRLTWLNCPRSSIFEAFFHTLIGVFVALFLRPQVLHIHAIGPSLLVPLARLLGMRVVTTNHGPDYSRQKWGALSKQILKLGERLGSRWSNRVIAISQPIADHLKAKFGLDATTIPNGVSVRTPSEKRDMLDRLGVVDKKYFLAVGRLVPEKGFHDLIEAFKRAVLPDWKLVIVGRADYDSRYSNELKGQAAQLPSIAMPGFLSGDPLNQVYSHAGALILPSYHEGLPIVMLEGMSFGLPTAASDIPANRHAGLPDECFFPVGDIEAITNRLCELATQDTTLDATRETRESRIDYVRSHFNWDRITQSTLQVYHEVLDGK